MQTGGREYEINCRSQGSDREVITSGEREVAGPTSKGSMFPEVHVSPFGVILKSEGKWRLIVDLSSPKGGSVNDGIRKELCSLSYMSVDEVAASVVKLGT